MQDQNMQWQQVFRARGVEWKIVSYLIDFEHVWNVCTSHYIQKYGKINM